MLSVINIRDRHYPEISVRIKYFASEMSQMTKSKNKLIKLEKSRSLYNISETGTAVYDDKSVSTASVC
jgi:hypothetical protein